MRDGRRAHTHANSLQHGTADRRTDWGALTPDEGTRDRLRRAYDAHRRQGEMRGRYLLAKEIIRDHGVGGVWRQALIAQLKSITGRSVKTIREDLAELAADHDVDLVEATTPGTGRVDLIYYWRGSDRVELTGD